MAPHGRRGVMSSDMMPLVPRSCRSAGLLGVAAVIAGCAKDEPPLATPWSDDFGRASVGSDWNDTGGNYRIENGSLAFEMAHNHPLWLRRALPADVRIDV